MELHLPYRLAATLALGCVASLWTSAAAASTPTAQQALGLKPVQKHVEYAKPATADEVAKCTIKPEKEGAGAAWVVRNGDGQILRRFADTNNDNVVDLWCYYRDGLEVYRDIDANANGKADQYRWFNLGGTRWGIDRNEDGQIDAWQVISPPEVAEELVLALQTGDSARFELLLPSSSELDGLGLDKKQADTMRESSSAASDKFPKFSAEQKVVTAQSRFLDYGGFRPATIPSGTAGSSKDVTIQDNVSALVETNGKNEQVLLGTLVKFGDTWKMIDLPSVDGGAESASNNLFRLLELSGGANADTASAASKNAPTDAMQPLMTELETLDKQAEGLDPEKRAPIVEKQAELLLQLAEMAPETELRDQWYRQLADMLSAEVQTGSFPQGIDRLKQLQEKLAADNQSQAMVSYVAYRQMLADFMLSQQAPDADAVKIQEKWLADLEQFIEKYPEGTDAAEAMLQLGMYQEFAGKTEPAQVWYEKLVEAYPETAPGRKATGAIRRLTSVGKPIRLRGQAVQGGQIDLAQYRGRPVLIQYWATWCEPCVEDMKQLKEVYQKYGGKDFEIIGVSLDETPGTVQQFLTANRFPWKQIYEPGGLDGRLAEEMGVMTLPLMILVDDKGNVIDHSVFVAELEPELKRLAK